MDEDLQNIAVIANEPTPYRLHVLRRLASELEGVRVHSLFTHSRASITMPWTMDLSDQLNPVFFDDCALRPGRPDFRRAYRLFRAIRRYLIERRVRLAIVHGYNDLTRLLLIRWGRRVGIPMLLSGDSNVLAEGRNPLPKHLAKWLMIRWLIRSVTGLMPAGSCGRAYFRAYLDHDKPTFIFPFEPDYQRLMDCPAQACRDFAASRGLDPNRRRLLFSGRLVPMKSVDLLIDAYSDVAEARPDWDLVIAGTGPLSQALAERVPRHLRHRVKWMGFLQFDELVACYHCCDALVLPSSFEPWALVINEAIASGLAVVSSEVVGAAADLVRHRVNGLIVPPRNRAALAAALYEMTEDGCCQQMQSAAAAVLAQWRQAADPVKAVRDALRHFGVAGEASRVRSHVMPSAGG